MTTVAIPTATQGISYTDLYARWERGHWLATEIDFSQDRIDWQERMSDGERKAALWFFALFFHGEDEVTDQLSPYVDAARSEEQTYFLTTQQVDEARHAIFFQRFMHEVVGLGNGTVGSGLDATRTQLTWGHRELFKHLAEVAGRLRQDHSPAMFAEGLMNYHMIVEGTLAQPGQHMLEAWLERADYLPGFREGMRHVSIDEQRHIAFGMKALSELYADDPETIGATIAGTMRATSQYLTDFAYPINGDRAFVEPLGVTLEGLYADSMRSLSSRLRGIGLSEEHQAQALPIGRDVTYEEQGLRMLRLLEAGYFGSGTRPKSHDADDLELYFTVLANTMKAYHPAGGTVLQFDFTDIPSRHYIVIADTVECVDGHHPGPSVTIHSSFDDFLELVSGRVHPLRLILTRRLKVSGDRGLLAGDRSLFGPSGEPRRFAALRAKFRR